MWHRTDFPKHFLEKHCESEIIGLVEKLHISYCTLPTPDCGILRPSVTTVGISFKPQAQKSWPHQIASSTALDRRIMGKDPSCALPTPNHSSSLTPDAADEVIVDSSGIERFPFS
jgi:hypothetical protein